MTRLPALRVSTRRALAILAALALTVAGFGAQNVAHGDTAPPVGTASTVSADVLPTWQINGVVWSQVVVNNTVYATGSFTKARPPGVPAGGSGEVSALNIFAYDLRTGNRVSTFNHSLNAQGRVITASPDGSRIYVGGDFTAVDGIARGHVAAFSTATGELTSFVANVNYRARPGGNRVDIVHRRQLPDPERSVAEEPGRRGDLKRSSTSVGTVGGRRHCSGDGHGAGPEQVDCRRLLRQAQRTDRQRDGLVECGDGIEPALGR